jgi:hypothetical protein
LHVTWVLLLWWSCRRFAPWIRAVALFYVLATVMATMGTGEHYFVDLVAAVPFALMVESICQSAIPIRKRLLPLLAGLLMTLGWLALVRLGTPLVLKSRAIPWTLVVLSTATAMWIEHRCLKVEVTPSSEPIHEASLTAVAAG